MRKLHFLIQKIRRTPHPENLRVTDMWAGLTETGKSSSVTRPRAGGSRLVFEARGISQTRRGNQIGGPRGGPGTGREREAASGCWLPTKSSRPPGSLKNTGEGAKLHQKGLTASYY